MKFYENARLGPRAVIPPYNYSAQKSKASLLEASFGVRGGQLWNTLPENIKVAPSLEALKAWTLLGGNPRLAAHYLILDRTQQFLARVGKKTWGPVSGKSPVSGKKKEDSFF